MVKDQEVKVKLSESISLKPVVPGPNSWAISEQQKQQQHTNGHLNSHKVITRDRYEDKPMPPPPPVSPFADSQVKPTAYVQPAVPFLSPAPARRTPQKRAATEPVVPKPLFGSRKISVTELRTKYSNPRPKASVVENEKEVSRKSRPGTPPPSEKGISSAHTLGLKTENGLVQDTSPVPVLESSIIDPFRSTANMLMKKRCDPAPQNDSTPVPTRRYLRENGVTTPSPTGFDLAGQHQAHKPLQDGEEKPLSSVQHTRATEALYPSRSGTYATIGEADLVETHGMRRVDSCVGVIENAGSGNTSGTNTCTNSSGCPSRRSMRQDVADGRRPPFNSNTLSDYDGVWENDPAVGYSLPPFSPMPGNHQSPSNASRDSPSQLTVPDIFNSFKQNCTRFSECQHSLPSANSWASEPEIDCLETTNSPLSALLPPRWPHHHSVNAVPSPPANQHDFQRVGSVSAALTKIELTVHHHIDTAFRSLSRLVNDKHDKMMDQTLHRLENLEDTVSKGLRMVKGEIKEFRRDFSEIQGHLSDLWKSSDQDMDLIKKLDGKMESMQILVEEHASKVERIIAEQGSGESEVNRQQWTTLHRRSESAKDAVGHGEPRQQYLSGVSGSSSSARQSETTSRRNRSNTTGSQSAGPISDEKNTRREFYAVLGVTRDAVPDLRDHPAFAGDQQRKSQAFQHSQTGLPNGLKGLPAEDPPLSDGRWYQQAYGQGR